MRIVLTFLVSLFAVGCLKQTLSIVIPSFVLGQADMTTDTVNLGGLSSSSLYNVGQMIKVGSKYIAADYSNNRVLIWNSFPAQNYQPADLVLGQPDMISDTVNNGGISNISMNLPWGVASDGVRLFVSDYGNSRVLIWNTIPTTNQAPADLVLGQPNMGTDACAIGANEMCFPYRVSVSGTRLVIADTGNNRVLIWDTIPTIDAQAPDRVLGQADLTTATDFSGAATSSTTYGPVDVNYDGTRLFVLGYDNRVLIWNSFPTSDNEAADVVLGQPDMISDTANNGGVSAQSLSIDDGAGIYSDGGHLYVSDIGNHRVLIWDTIPTQNTQAADRVLGQPDMSSSANDNGGLDSGLHRPSGLFFDGVYLYIADYFNHRVIIRSY